MSRFRNMFSSFRSRDFRLFRPRPAPEAPTTERPLHMAMVLLPEARLPDPQFVAAALRSFGGGRYTARLTPSVSVPPGGATEVLAATFPDGSDAMVGLVPVPIPNGEAESGAAFSASGLRGSWTPSPHNAHLIVASPAGDDRLESLSRFTSLLAALLQASSGLGVYWHHATHRPEFFLDLAGAEDTRDRIMLWSGISVGHEEGDRVSILSWLLEDLGLPDLLVTAPRHNGQDAMDSFFDILAYVVDRKEPIPDGDTFGRTEHERIRVRYVPSPADAKRRVCCIDLPEV